MYQRYVDFDDGVDNLTGEGKDEVPHTVTCRKFMERFELFGYAFRLGEADSGLIQNAG
jgi:hypothetical protein